MAKTPVKRDIGRVVTWSDSHHPFIDPIAHEAVYGFCRGRTDVHVHIGDCLDLGGIGHHVEADLVAQYEDPVLAGLLSLGKHFNHLFKITPKAHIIWIFGNHTDRLFRFVKKNPAWRGIIDDPIGLLKSFGGCSRADRIEIVHLTDYTEDFKIGKMHFCHGFSTGKHVACTHVEAYDESVTFGHAHTMQMFTKVKRGNPKAGYCVGHMLSEQARRYLKGAPARWVTGFAYMEYDMKTGNFTQHLLPIVDGGFFYGGKYYSGNRRSK